MAYSLTTISRRCLGPNLASLRIGSMLALLALPSCSGAPAALSILTAPLKIALPDGKPNLPDPEPIQTRPVKWRVITPDRLPPGEDWVLYAVTPKDYENLSHTNADTLRYTKDAKWRLRYYRGEETAK